MDAHVRGSLVSALLRRQRKTVPVHIILPSVLLTELDLLIHAQQINTCWQQTRYDGTFQCSQWIEVPCAYTSNIATALLIPHGLETILPVLSYATIGGLFVTVLLEVSENNYYNDFNKTCIRFRVPNQPDFVDIIFSHGELYSANTTFWRDATRLLIIGKHICNNTEVNNTTASDILKRHTQDVPDTLLIENYFTATSLYDSNLVSVQPPEDATSSEEDRVAPPIIQLARLLATPIVPNKQSDSTVSSGLKIASKLTSRKQDDNHNSAVKNINEGTDNLKVQKKVTKPALTFKEALKVCVSKTTRSMWSYNHWCLDFVSVVLRNFVSYRRGTVYAITYKAETTSQEKQLSISSAIDYALTFNPSGELQNFSEDAIDTIIEHTGSIASTSLMPLSDGSIKSFNLTTEIDLIASFHSMCCRALKQAVIESTKDTTMLQFVRVSVQDYAHLNVLAKHVCKILRWIIVQESATEIFKVPQTSALFAATVKYLVGETKHTWTAEPTLDTYAVSFYVCTPEHTVHKVQAWPELVKFTEIGTQLSCEGTMFKIGCTENVVSLCLNSLLRGFIIFPGGFAKPIYLSQYIEHNTISLAITRRFVQ